MQLDKLPGARPYTPTPVSISFSWLPSLWHCLIAGLHCLITGLSVLDVWQIVKRSDEKETTKGYRARLKLRTDGSGFHLSRTLTLQARSAEEIDAWEALLAKLIESSAGTTSNPLDDADDSDGDDMSDNEVQHRNITTSRLSTPPFAFFAGPHMGKQSYCSRARLQPCCSA